MGLLMTDTNQDDFLDYALQHGFGELHMKVDSQTGMKAIIAIHNTNLGPALGGCRFIPYANTQAAILDAMRLARGMSYKSALANLPLGGGKSVIIEPSEAYDRTAYLHAFGRFINDLNGRYITALDSGTQLVDMDVIAQHTSYVASSSRHHSDPSPATAKGVFRGIQASVKFKLGKDSLQGLHVAIQGLGHVGYLLAHHLHKAGAQLTVADISATRVAQVVAECNARAVAPDTIHQVACDVFAPCALGAVINDETINELQTPIVAGAANNQLAHTYHGLRLHEKGILYAPDYVINAGGVIFAACKYFNFSENELHAKLDSIHDSLMQIFMRANEENLPTSTVADNLAEEKIG